MKILNLLRKELGDKIEYITPRVYKSVQATRKNESGSLYYESGFPDHQFLEKTIIDEGKFIDERDVKTKSRVVVIGRLVEQDLFKNESALGKFIELNGLAYKVVGIFSDAGGDNEERLIYAPVSTIQLIHKNTDDIDQINLSFNKAIGVAGAKKMVSDISKILKEKHNVSKKTEAQFVCDLSLMIISKICNLPICFNLLYYGLGLVLYLPEQLPLEILWFLL